MKKIIYLVFSFLFFLSIVYSVQAQSVADWHMAGANPQRTSWVSAEVRGNLGVDWYQAIEPYIPYRVQPIFYNGVAYISTAKGLYAFDLTANIGSGGTRVKWIYPTELPLGHSPSLATINGKTIAYVGGYDRKIHAVDTTTGQALSGYIPFEAGAGFDTNPLIINDSFTGNIPFIIAGNRDGKEYALNALTGAKIWEFTTGGSITFSSAYKDGVIYFASNDLYAYAVNIGNGLQKWKSQKFQYSAGFFSYWPMVYTEKNSGVVYVSFTGATNYRFGDESEGLHIKDQKYFIPGCITSSDPCPSTLWSSSTVNNDPYFLNGTKLWDINGSGSVPGITNYFEDNPHRRMVFILNAQTGQEFSYDTDGDSKAEYAPFLWASGTTYSGNKFPGIVNGVDNIYYNSNLMFGNRWIARGGIVGWKLGSTKISDIGTDFAVDEPISYASGGKIIYWSLCCDRMAMGNDVTLPLSSPNRRWSYWSYDINIKAPDYLTMYNDGDAPVYNNGDGWQLYAGKNQSKNGIYGKHGSAQAPPIPYGGKLYVLKGNALIAFKPSAGSPVKLALAQSTSVQRPPIALSPNTLRTKLETEIQKIINTSPMRPGYLPGSLLGNFSGNYSDWHTIDTILDYFYNPADTVYTLLLAYPQVSTTLQSQIKTYLQNNYGPGKTYDVTQVQHIGWSNNVSREAGTVPPDRTQFRVGGPSTWKPCCAGGYWEFPPFNFYAAWKYAQIVRNNDQTFARNIFNSMSNKIEPPTNTTFLIQKPYFINQYAAGYYGYLQLKQLAGLGGDATVQGYYNQMLALRNNNFSGNTAYWPASTWCGTENNCAAYWSAMSVAANFAFLTPEIAAHMRQIQSQVAAAVNEYQYIAPYWFVGKFDATVGEGTIHHLYDSPSLFQAKAWILNQPFGELIKYLDVPAFERGDLFYIQNLTAALQSGSGTVPTTGVSPSITNTRLQGDINSDGIVNVLDFTLLSNAFGTDNSAADINGDNIVNILDFTILSNNFGRST